jgi:2-hydroxy-3-oxopropionate reductase
VTNIAFIGLGIMGSPMAVHLAETGHSVVGYNRSREKTKPLVDAAGRAGESVADAVRGAEVVCLMVPDSADVVAVLPGPDGVLANAAAGTLVIDFSSIRPDVTTELAEAAKRHRLRLLDAPVSGGEAGAVNAALSIMVGGAAADFEAAREVFDVVGRTIVHVGPTGAAQTKDLAIVTAAAREAGVVTPLGGLVAQLMASALANGDGGLDHSGLLRGVERLSGRVPK